jgi:tetratricopeptide (TPR) repeat protein
VFFGSRFTAAGNFLFLPMVALTSFAQLLTLATGHMNKLFLSVLVFAGVALCFQLDAEDAISTAPENPATTAETSGVSEVPALSNETMRLNLQLQEKIHATQLAVERAERASEIATASNAAILSNRLQAMQLAIEHNERAHEIAMANNALILSNRLQAIEHTVELQRQHESELVHAMVMIAGAFVVVGVLALLFTAYFHWRAVSRLGEIAAGLPTNRGLGAFSTINAAGLAESQLSGKVVEQSNTRLLGAIERLERRIMEIERSTGSNHLTNSGAENSEAQTHGKSPAALPETSSGQANGKATPISERVTVLLGKGQSLLDDEEAEQAITCFDQALALDPDHPEVLVKKGDALERLRRTQEAIESYDRAIAADNSMTIAYLHKGGLLNRMERFDEAMRCYELALQTQEKKRAA